MKRLLARERTQDMNTKDEAERLAHWLERDGANCQQHIDASALLRRQTAEIERLTTSRDEWKEVAAVRLANAECEKNKALHTENAKLSADAGRYQYCKNVMYADDSCCDDEYIDNAIKQSGEQG
jgi:hypothetical protein